MCPRVLQVRGELQRRGVSAAVILQLTLVALRDPSDFALEVLRGATAGPADSLVAALRPQEGRDAFRVGLEFRQVVHLHFCVGPCA